MKRILYVLQKQRKAWALNACILAAMLILGACSISTAKEANVVPIIINYDSSVSIGEAEEKIITLGEYSISFDGYRCYSRFKKYQPGVNDVRIVIATEGKAVRVENSIRLEKQEADGSWITIPRTERYIQALEEAGRPAETGAGYLSMGENDTTSLFWLCKTRLEDEPLEEGCYRVVFIANGEEQQFPFIVSRDGWDGKPGLWKELRTYPAVLYQGHVYYRSTARTSKRMFNENEIDTSPWENIGTTRRTDTENYILNQDMDCLTLNSGDRVFYDEANDRIFIELVSGSNKLYYVLDEKISSANLK